MSGTKGKRERRNGRTRRRGPLRIAVRWAVRALVVLVLLPLVLTPLYRWVNPVSTLMVWTALTGEQVDRRWVGLDSMAPSLPVSVLVSEDGRFCSHDGVDWEAVRTVLEEESDRPRGASTIAMQTAKNLFLWQSRSYLRKALEVPLALYVDIVLGKRRLMEVYLNVVQWGPGGVFGAEAAAQRHFGRSASALTADQSARLAVVLPAPDLRDPAQPSSRVRALANTIVARARASGGYIDCLGLQGSL